MRSLLLALTLLALCSVPVFAAPFLYCASYTTGVIPTYFKVSLDGGPEVIAPAWSGTSADGTAWTNTSHYDLSGVSVGDHVAVMKACVGDLVWGTEACSAASAPFSFPRPAPPVGPPSGPSGFVLKR